MNCNDWPLAVCSWSLRTDVAGVAASMRTLGIDRVNLALKPCFAEGGDEYLAAVRRQPWKVSATTIGFFQEDYSTLDTIRATGGIVPDEHWAQNREMVFRAAEITAELGVRFLTMHAGFLESSDPEHSQKIRERLGCLADAARRQGIVLLLETGQETASCLRALLEELNHPALGINFDPANVILYDKGDPIDAVRALGRWMKHVHVKDAVRTTQPGRWGTETPWGDGEVGVDAFLGALGGVGYSGVLAIEREAGADRLGDIRLAVERLTQYGQTTR